MRTLSSSWWGPPRKFDPEIKERRVSWLELFYDLVYVIAISRITHHLASHISVDGFLEYLALFMLIFWGWLNGSLYHDLHGGLGLRTRLMTLWQVMIIAALSVTIDLPSQERYVYMTIVFMIMQFYITYMWWSVGFYDPAHRRYNQPYTIMFLISLGLMGLSLTVSPDWLRFLVPVVIICNYSPPFIAQQLLRRSSLDLNLSSSMAERLGLFTIIVFGELVLGVVNGVSNAGIHGFTTWLKFSLALAVIFSLWWIFFTLLSNRNAKKGFNKATWLEILCIPSLTSLGVIAACLGYFFDESGDAHTLHLVFGCAIATFLACISLMMGLLDYEDIVSNIKKPFRASLLVTALVFLGLSFSGLRLSTVYYLALVLAIIVAEILYLNILYFSLVVRKQKNDEQEDQS